MQINFIQKLVNCRRTEGSQFNSNKKEHTGIIKLACEGLPVRGLISLLLCRTWSATNRISWNWILNIQQNLAKKERKNKVCTDYGLVEMFLQQQKKRLKAQECRTLLGLCIVSFSFVSLTIFYVNWIQRL